jgi:pilus assembly protein Flp/PilA
MNKFKASTDFVTAYLVSNLKLKEKGATAVEYGIMVAAIAAVIIAIVISIGGQVNDSFTEVDTELGGIGA